MKFKHYIILATLALISKNIQAAPLSGSYTIGGTSPAYATFTDAVTDLAANGVSGPVTFNVRAGIYNEQIIIPAITGASASNTITFQPESGVVSDVTLEFSNTENENYVIELNNASYITIQNLTVTSTEPTLNYGQLIYFVNRCDYDQILNNNLIGLPVTSWYTEANVIYTYCPSTGLRIEGNTISNGTESIIWLGTDNTPGGLMNCSVVKNNTMINAYEWSMAIAYQNNSVMEGNTFFSSNSPDLNLGMQIQDVVNPLLIINNKFTYSNTICALYIVNNHPSDLAHSVTVANNFFSMTNATAMELINDEYSQFYNNSVYSEGNAVAFVDYGNSRGSVLSDNIFYEAGGAVAMNIDSGAVSACDHNDLYTTGAYLCSWNNTNESNLSAWQTASGFDAHSQSLVPPYTSFSDLHLTSYNSMRFGTPNSAFPADIDNYLRGPSPTVGADDTGTVPYIHSYTSSCCGCSQPAFEANPTTICAGNSIQFTDQSGDNPTGWQWTFKGGIPANSNLQNPTVTYDSAGTFDVRLVVTTTMGMDSVIRSGYITVNLGTVAGNIKGTNTVCRGNAIQLIDTGSAGAIQWQSSMDSISFSDLTGNTSVSYANNTLDQTTYYRVMASGACGLDSSNIHKVTVNPLPTPTVSSADSIFCSGDSTRICTSGSFASYNWSTGDTSACTIAKQAGGYWLTVTDANGCSVVSNHQSISVYPVPSVSIALHGDTLFSFNSNAYQWLYNGTPINGATQAFYVATATGNYTVQITDSNGCQALSGSQYILITGSEDLYKNSEVHIFPNPTANTVFVLADNMYAVEVYDLTGRKIFTINNVALGSRMEIHLADFKSGCYYFKIKTSGADFYRPVIKQ